jgi:hypothetical protein
LNHRQPGDFYFFQEAEQADEKSNTLADPWESIFLSATDKVFQMPSAGHDIGLNKDSQLYFNIKTPNTRTYYLWLRSTIPYTQSQSALRISINGAAPRPFEIVASGGMNWVGGQPILLEKGDNRICLLQDMAVKMLTPLDMIAVTDNVKYIPLSLIASHPDIKVFPQLFKLMDISLATSDLRSARKGLAKLCSMDRNMAIAEYAINVRPLHWQVVGPFEGMERKDLLTINPPDKDLYVADLNVPQYYMNGTLKHQVRPITQAYEYMSKPQRGNLEMDATGTYYAFTEIYSARNKGVAVLLGLDDWAIVTHNGKEIYRFQGRSTGSFYGNYKVRVRLQKGKNVFGIKLINGGGPGGFHFDLIDENQLWPIGVIGK